MRTSPLRSMKMLEGLRSRWIMLRTGEGKSVTARGDVERRKAHLRDVKCSMADRIWNCRREEYFY